MEPSITELWPELVKASDLARERRDCAVKALAAVTGVSYEEARKALRARGRKDRQGTCPYQYYRALEDLGWKYRPVVSRYRGNAEVDFYPRARTIKSAGDTLPRNKRFLVTTYSHVAAVRAGRVIDSKTHGLLRVRDIVEVYR